jgi:hypothetical protein
MIIDTFVTYLRHAGHNLEGGLHTGHVTLSADNVSPDEEIGLSLVRL